MRTGVKMIPRLAISSAALAMGVAIALSGCSAKVQGIPVLPNGASPIHRVEWVTDPESDSSVLLAVTIRGDGTFYVGRDFPPGIYLSDGSLSGSSCRWQRLAHDSARAPVVIASGSGTGPQLIAIKATDSDFSTQSCKPWRLLR